MSIFNLEDKLASIRCLAFPRAFAECREIIADFNVDFVEGRLKVDDDERVALIVDNIQDL